MTAAIILAAGRSTRMGQSKPLLRYEAVPGHTFVSRLVEVLKTSGFIEILVVGRPDDDGLRAEVDRCAATFIENRRADEGQLSSLLAALTHLAARDGTQVEAVLVTPVDAPLISSAVVNRLMRAAAASPAQILRATHAGKHGHPVIFRRSTFDELYAADPSVGARAVVRADPQRVEDVEVEDDGVTIDFDTPDEYRRYFGTPPSTSR
ncbi:MAG TPA: nucleotidyltransferase family protein [Vicinamibacterales bacterium]|nr:nucleotidyltransferase family protein [Vicinamibacterales bacterium]